MGNYLHRTTKSYCVSVSPTTLPWPLGEYISMPDMTAVEEVPSKYWIINGDVVTKMSQEEKDVVDAEALTTRRDSAVNGVIDNLESDLRQLVRLIISELNILRAEHNLPDRTMAQFKSQIRNGYGN